MEGMTYPANRNIFILYRYNQRFFQKKLEEYGLEMDLGQLPVYIYVYNHPGAVQEKIAARTYLDKGTVARAIQRMEKGGFAFRETDEADRRVNHVYLTKKAKEAYPAIQKAMEELHGVLYGGMTEEETATILRLLARMKDNMDAYFDVPRETESPK
ncbi:MarR family winged helix-turn-helix transcriptional regulator [Eubacteriales bacterium OttesenSCG-928-M02]|nr:MarR family winged helix-turn-helix transcriptional regulator [Eubacteriales bacterium OttesenSCG-928-M02]